MLEQLAIGWKVVEDISTIITVLGGIKSGANDIKELHQKNSDKFVQLSDGNEELDIDESVKRAYDSLFESLHDTADGIITENESNEIKKLVYDKVNLNYIDRNEFERLFKDVINKLNYVINSNFSQESKMICYKINHVLSNQEELLDGKKILITGQKEINEKLDILINSKKEKSIINVNEDSSFTSENLCVGYGTMKGKCRREVISDDAHYCLECSKKEYFDNIKNIYKLQNIDIDDKNDYFIATIAIGVLRASTYVIPIFLGNENYDEKLIYELAKIISKVTKKNNSIQIVSDIVMNSDDRDSLEQISDNIDIFSKEKLVNDMINFETYMGRLKSDYEKSELSKHFIELYDDEFYYNEDETQILDYTISDFLDDDSANALWIFGDYGCGKTSLLQYEGWHQSKRFYEQYEESEEERFIPIVIPLNKYTEKGSVNQIVLEEINEKGNLHLVNIESFFKMMEYRKFVIFFDGFDEVAKRIEYDVKYKVITEICKYCVETTKVIITCRPNYFADPKELERLLQSSHLQYEPGQTNNAEFSYCRVAALNEEQISKYIDSYKDAFISNKTDKDTIQKIIANTHDLTDLSRRPFLLYMIVDTLPKIIKNAKEKGDEEQIKINASNLYKIYTSRWLDRENRKGRTLINSKDKTQFCIELAFKMYQDNIYEINYIDFPKEIHEFFKDVVEDTKIDYYSQDIQTCSFLNSDEKGNFKFIHKSFMEYFVAIYFVDRLKKIKSDISSVLECLNIGIISSEIASFIKDIYISENISYDEMVSIITSVKNSETHDKNSYLEKNIITILSKFGVNIAQYLYEDEEYAGSDFSDAHIEDVELKNMDFTDVVFNKAIIKNTTFVGCTFHNASFKKAALHNVSFEYHEFIGTNFEGANIDKCDFSDTAFNEVNFKHTTFDNCNFENVDMGRIECDKTVMINCKNTDTIFGLPYEIIIR